MDCFGNSSNYSDYRIGMMNGAGANAVPYNGHHHHPYANYHRSSNMRYPHMTNYRNDANDVIPYDRYGGYGPANHAYGHNNAGYNSSAYAYSPNSGSQTPIDARSNPFYAQHQHTAYDPYNSMTATNNNYASSSSHSQYAYHQRDFHSFETSASYRTRGAGTGGANYMMRDLYQHPYADNNQTHCADYMPMPSNSMPGNAVGNTSPSTAILSPGLKTGPQHHHPHSYQPMHGPSFSDFHKNLPMGNHNQYAMDPNGFSPHPTIGKLHLIKYTIFFFGRFIFNGSVSAILCSSTIECGKKRIRDKKQLHKIIIIYHHMNIDVDDENGDNLMEHSPRTSYKL